MSKKNLFYIFVAAVAVVLSSCTERISISGSVSDAGSAVMYLYHDMLSQREVVDSVKLTDKGDFQFKVAKAASPEYYRLTLNGRSLVLAIDSLTTDINVVGEGKKIDEARIEGSDASVDIQRLRLSAYRLQELARTSTTSDVDAALATHKAMAQSIILSDTHSAAAYYAIYQTINGMYIFHPAEKDDLPYWTAVATGFDMNYPASERTKELKTTVLIAQKEMRSVRLSDEALLDSVSTTGALELSLPDRSGERVSLSSLKGKVVLLDFSAYGMESATAHILFLRELYDSYHDSDFEIYQVSLDQDKLLWMEHSRQVPWVCVRDERGPQTMSVITYNVTQMPTFFLIDRDGDVVGRYNHENIAEAVAAACRR